jgi:hypothetical protein
MENITDYMFVQADNFNALAQEVKKFMVLNWKPFGSPINASDSNRHNYAQAMVQTD